MSRRVQLIALCEDRQHETFLRRFLERAGWSTRALRVVMSPAGRGSGEQFVRTRFPQELAAYRRNRNRVALGLIVMCDGDSAGHVARLRELDRECQARQIPARSADEAVAVFCPTWNVETWLAYLSGSTVDERRSDYPRLARPRDCQPHVETLYAMCEHDKALRHPAPPSLQAACEEYRRLP